MPISTTQLYDRSASLMARLTARADRLQTQIATNNRLAAPSDDAGAYAQLSGLRRATGDDAAYTANLRTAASLLRQTDTALTSIEAQLQQAVELSVQANNGTLDDAARATIGTQIANIRDTLAGIANQDDLRGGPLFGGRVTLSATGATFEGGAAAAAIPIGEGQSVQATESAGRVFGDTFGVLRRLSDALSGSGDPAALASAGDDLTAALDQVTAVHGAVGARAARVDLESTRLAAVAVDRKEAQSALEEPDITATITELQKTMTVLQATQASFTKLSALSLFDYLR